MAALNGVVKDGLFDYVGGYCVGTMIDSLLPKPTAVHGGNVLSECAMLCGQIVLDCVAMRGMVEYAIRNGYRSPQNANFAITSAFAQKRMFQRFSNLHLYVKDIATQSILTTKPIAAPVGSSKQSAQGNMSVQ